jgi:cytochrome oxidase assembly protein ShyY1
VAFLTSARGLRLLAFAAVMAVACVLLGMWQLDRYEQRGERNAAVRSAIAADPVPLATLVPPGTAPDDVPASAEWRVVSVRGQFDDSAQVLLRLRQVGGQSGVHVLTPLVPADGPAVLVDRGFIASGSSTQSVQVPPPPSGTVEVTGRLHRSETGRGTGLAPETTPPSIRFVDLAPLAQEQGLELAPVWLESIEPLPADLVAVPAPTLSAGPSLIYAVQWFLFATIAVGGFVVLARRESRAPAPQDAPAADAATPRSPA